MTRGASFLIALLVVAACLRSPVTAVGPLLDMIRGDLALTATAAGLLSSLPLVMFGGFAPVARLARNHGTERVLFVCLLVLVAGVGLRSAGGVLPLFGGTVVLAGGIAVANILIPILVKQHFPGHIAGITTAYASVMGGFAALGSGLAAPLARVLPGGWQGSLGSWALPALVALVLWLPHLRHDVHVLSAAEAPAQRLPWNRALAWQVTGFMGMQSTVFYVTINWLPAMLRDSGGVPVEISGWLLTLYQVAALLGGLAIPPLVRRFADQRGLAAATGLITAAALLGVLLAPRLAVAWMVLLGLGSGPALILALSFMGLRAGNPQMAGALSLMAQCFGYLLAACGPVVFGYVHDLTQGWTWPMLLTVGAACGMVVCGVGAGRSLRL